jgi:hypothetical protein
MGYRLWLLFVASPTVTPFQPFVDRTRFLWSRYQARTKARQVGIVGGHRESNKEPIVPSCVDICSQSCEGHLFLLFNQTQARWNESWTVLVSRNKSPLCDPAVLQAKRKLHDVHLVTPVPSSSG